MEILGGPLFAVAGAGESHGPGVSTLVLGCPPGVRVSRTAVQSFLDRRRPGSNRHGTPRHEGDKVVFTAGLFNPEAMDDLLTGPDLQLSLGAENWSTPTYEEGYSTGEPIAALVLSTSSKSRHYEQFAGDRGEVRPGHTDLVKHYKSKGFVDYRGGGRSSYRATISDVIGGSIARIFLEQTFGTVFLSSICQVGELKTDKRLSDVLSNDAGAEAVMATERAMSESVIYSVDAEFAAQAGELIKETRKKGDSLGAKLEVIALNVPPLIGEPLYQSLKLRLMGSLGGLHAVRACEVGAGLEVVARRGSANNDPIRAGGYASNNHGGMLGGVTTGAPLVARVSFKPTSTINVPQKSVRKDLSETDFELGQGRHDPCVGVRAGVTLESRMAIEVMNAVLVHQASRVHGEDFKLFP